MSQHEYNGDTVAKRTYMHRSVLLLLAKITGGSIIVQDINANPTTKAFLGTLETGLSNNDDGTNLWMSGSDMEFAISSYTAVQQSRRRGGLRAGASDENNTVSVLVACLIDDNKPQVYQIGDWLL